MQSLQLCKRSRAPVNARGLGPARQAVGGGPALPLGRSAGGSPPCSFLQIPAKRFLQGCRRSWGKTTQLVQNSWGKLTSGLFHLLEGEKSPPALWRGREDFTSLSPICHQNNRLLTLLPQQPMQLPRRHGPSSLSTWDSPRFSKHWLWRKVTKAGPCSNPAPNKAARDFAESYPNPAWHSSFVV